MKFGSYTSACHFSAVDHAAIARACGCKCTAVTSASILRSRLPLLPVFVVSFWCFFQVRETPKLTKFVVDAAVARQKRSRAQ